MEKRRKLVINGIEKWVFNRHLHCDGKINDKSGKRREFNRHLHRNGKINCKREKKKENLIDI